MTTQAKVTWLRPAQRNAKKEQTAANLWVLIELFAATTLTETVD